MVETNQILQSSDSTIVIPCLSRSFGFKTNEYQKYEQQLLGLIDRKEFQGFVRKCKLDYYLSQPDSRPRNFKQIKEGERTILQYHLNTAQVKYWVGNPELCSAQYYCLY